MPARQGATAQHGASETMKELEDLRAQLDAYKAAEAARKAKGEALRQAREAKAAKEGRPVRQPRAAAAPRIAVTVESVVERQERHPRWSAVEWLARIAEKRIDAGASLSNAVAGTMELYEGLVAKTLQRRPNDGRPDMLATLGTLIQDEYPDDFQRLGPRYGAPSTRKPGSKSGIEAAAAANPDEQMDPEDGDVDEEHTDELADTEFGDGEEQDGDENEDDQEDEEGPSDAD